MINHTQNSLLERAPAPEDFGTPGRSSRTGMLALDGAVGLLVKANAIAAEDLREAEEISADMGLTLQNVLVRSHFIDSRSMEAAQSAQNLIDSKRLCEWIAVQALKDVCHQGVSFESALGKLGWGNHNSSAQPYEW